jgi:hypothetical protein
MDNLPAEMLNHFPHGTPASYLSLFNGHQPASLGHICALAIIYALKILHLIHFLTYPATTRTKPAISYQKCPERSNRSTKRSVNRRTSFKTKNAPNKTTQHSPTRQSMKHISTTMTPMIIKKMTKTNQLKFP